MARMKKLEIERMAKGLSEKMADALRLVNGTRPTAEIAHHAVLHALANRGLITTQPAKLKRKSDEPYEVAVLTANGLLVKDARAAQDKAAGQVAKATKRR